MLSLWQPPLSTPSLVITCHPGSWVSVKKMGANALTNAQLPGRQLRAKLSAGKQVRTDEVLMERVEVPQSSEYGTYKAVETRFGPCLSGKRLGS